MFLLLASPSFAQFGGGGIPEAKELVQVSAAPVTIAAGGRAEARVTLKVLAGWHVNANPPSLDYMIPTVVSVAAAEGIRAGTPVYPPPHEEKLSFEDTPLLVYDGESVVTLPLLADPGAAPGARTLRGKLSFQSCNNNVCLAPTSLEFDLAVTVEGVATGASAAPETMSSAPSGSASPEAGFYTAPPPGTGAALPDNPIARLLAGGSMAAFFGLFAIGLALNLTPCVYPMLGVTVSIFGARKAAPPLQVFGLAALYVLGMAVMYSTLGVVAAFTGGLFGGALQSPVVQVGIGLLLAALALSMFGLYELTPPPWLMDRVGGHGATGAVGVFLSGLLVGIIAAPCIGPPVVALLAVVGAKGDPWFGFQSFFTLALGLGAPYLVLGTFSNLLQRLPRSGGWMVWVKKVFGTIMLSVGLFYILLALTPKLAFWLPPVALIAGGIYLGFFAGDKGDRPWFRRLQWGMGVLAAIGGAIVIATTPSKGIAFETFDEAALSQTLAQNRPVMIDFTANWCAPCHELDRFTFTDRRVVSATREFRAFKVDLTKLDSPEAEGWRKRYGVNGVPTVLFLGPGGKEVRPARVEGFLPPERFLERVQLAAEAGATAAGQ